MARPPEKQSLVGFTIGKCKLLKVCGRGAMGTVYHGLHTGLDIDVAVKILPDHLASNKSLVERFVREAKLAARLNHPNTVRVFDVGEESGYHYLVMEFVKGSDALQLVKRHGPQPAWVVADIGAGAARALAQAHAGGVVHRDVKPANLMLPEGGGVKVADFGLARALSSQSSGLTMTGAIMGTPDYMAPEQAQGKPAGTAADAYALGGTLYHLFTGRPPYKGASPMAVALQHVTGRIMVPDEFLRAEADRALAGVIHLLTEKDETKRLSDMPAAAAKLTAVAMQRPDASAKLMSDGATLFATVGLKLDAKAIEEAKRAASAPAMEPFRDTDPPKPAAKPISTPQEKPLTPGMLDNLRKAAADARARHGSALLDDLPPIEEPEPMKATARERPKAPAERRPTGRQDGGPKPEEHAWDGYEAKAFPTFERKAIMEGKAASPTASPGASGGRNSLAPWEQNASRSPADSTGFNPYDIGPVDEPLRSARKSSGAGVGLLAALVLIAGVAAAGWYFFVRGGGATNEPSPDPVAQRGLPLAYQTWTAHSKRTAVQDVLAAGPSVYTCGVDGSVHRWEEGGTQPAATFHDDLVLRAIALEPGGARLAAAAGDGRVCYLHAGTLDVVQPWFRMGNSVRSMVWASGGLVTGDESGFLRKEGNPIPVRVSTTAVAALIEHEGRIWAGCEDGTLAAFRIEGKDLREEKRLGLGAPILSFAVARGSIYVLLRRGGQVFEVRRLDGDKLAGETFEASHPVLCAVAGGEHLAVLKGADLLYLDPQNLQPAGTLPMLLPGHSATAAGPGWGAQSVAVGTSLGQLFNARP